VGIVTQAENLGEAIRELRKRTGVTQTEFAWMVGCSLPSIQNYEAGKKPSANAIAVFYELALKGGHTDLAERLKPELEARTKSRTVFPGKVKETVSAGYRPEHKKYHDMLEEVLASGSKKARDAVLPNLEVVWAYIHNYSGKKPSTSKANIGGKSQIR
jgi:transcriptional regulator with XRE-family HTH domain